MNSNQILLGDCRELMASLPSGSIDLVITDPPYLANYKSRDGRTIANDQTSEWMDDAFAETFRLLKPNSYCVCFYGWHKADVFMRAWKRAGFTPVGHLVWIKPYPSRRGYMAGHHEQAYLLAKGRPKPPTCVLNDVLTWKYSGNRLHPTQKPFIAIFPLVKTFSQPGDLVFDPFAGSGTTALASIALGRRYLGMEIIPEYWRLANARLKHWHRRNPYPDEG
jgi:adenine-specific DNA-methyltransferase